MYTSLQTALFCMTLNQDYVAHKLTRLEIAHAPHETDTDTTLETQPLSK